MLNYKNKKTLVLKLGGQCNLHCKFCHCKRLDFKFNQDILKYIDKENFTHIVFSGGEPLIYWKYIEIVLQHCGKEKIYKIVTNTTLLTNDIVKVLNEYNVHIGASYDGDNESRDYSYLPRYDKVSKVKNNNLVVLYSNENLDIELLDYQVLRTKDRYNLFNSNNRYWINFPHQTRNNKNEDITIDIAKQYCTILMQKLELEFLDIKNKKFNIGETPILNNCFNRWIRKINERGVKCCRERVIPMTIEGKFLLCPYDEQYVGDIYTGIDWNKVESYIPERCKRCSQWKSCMNTCIANITDNECFISKVIYKHFYKLMKKYNITYKQLENGIGR